ncbi:MAG: hypothetical protein Q9163_001095 [Psora crenata]
MSSTGFYGQALARNRPIRGWKQDDDGVWQPNPTSLAETTQSHDHCRPNALEEPPTNLLAVLQGLHLADVGEATSVGSDGSSVTGECGDERHYSTSKGNTPPKPLSDSGILPSITPSRSATPVARVQLQCVEAMLAGIGSNVLSDAPTIRRGRLDMTHEPYQAQFVEFKKAQACGRMNTALTNAWPASEDQDPFQLAVLPHDALCRSNGLKRINEERAAICLAIRDIPTQRDDEEPHFCEVCILPPDYYDEIATYVAADAHQRVLVASTQQQTIWGKLSRRPKMQFLCVLAVTLFVVSIGVYAKVLQY